MSEPKTTTADLRTKLNALYERYEQDVPPTHGLVLPAERDYNEGLYKGRLQAMETVVHELLGIDGDQLAEAISSDVVPKSAERNDAQDAH